MPPIVAPRNAKQVDDLSVKPMILCMVLVNSLFVVFAVLSFSKMASYRRDFHIDINHFDEVLRSAVRDYLVSLTPSDDVSSQSSDSLSEPTFKFIDGLSFGHSPARGDFFVLSGNRFVVGDYSPLGRVLGVTSDRAYCQQSNNVVIVRSSQSGQQRNSWFDSGRGGHETERDGDKNSAAASVSPTPPAPI